MIHDTSGQLSEVTGEGTLVGNVSSYASGFEYRAWGGTGSVNFGNGTNQETSFNPRLQPTSASINGLGYGVNSISWSYDYYDDGRQKHAYNGHDDRFDRLLEYDFVGRLKTAYSGREARGLAPSSPYADSPFQESFQYDAFNNRIQKNGRFWRSSQSGSTACVPRQQADGCDSEGNLKTFLYDEHSYDAAGEQFNFKNWRNTVGGSPNHLEVLPSIEIAQTYDSDGRPAKRIETRRTQELIGLGPQTDIFTSETATYYLYSTVLGGAKIVELGGERVSTTYVYANGLRIAKQNIEQNANESWVSWNHVNPGSNSFVETYSDTSIRLEERDPDGAEMGTDDPLANVVEPPTYENLKGEEPLYIEGGDPYNYSGSLTIDGLPVSQAEFNRRMQNGSAGAQVSVGGRPMVFVTNQQQLQHVTLDIFQVDNELQGRPQSQRWGGTYYMGTIDMNISFAGPAPFVGSQPQNTGFNLGKSAGFNDDQKTILGQVYNRINEKNCKDFINKTLADNRVATDRNSLEKLLARANVNAYYRDYTNTQLGVSSDEANVLRDSFVNRKDPALTLRDQIIFLDKRAFERNGGNYLREVWGTRNIDTATIVVHELLHVAGLNDPLVQNLNRQIHENCGFNGMSY